MVHPMENSPFWDDIQDAVEQLSTMWCNDPDTTCKAQMAPPPVAIRYGIAMYLERVGSRSPSVPSYMSNLYLPYPFFAPDHPVLRRGHDGGYARWRAPSTGEGLQSEYIYARDAFFWDHPEAIHAEPFSDVVAPMSHWEP